MVAVIFLSSFLKCFFYLQTNCHPLIETFDPLGRGSKMKGKYTYTVDNERINYLIIDLKRHRLSKHKKNVTSLRACNISLFTLVVSSVTYYVSLFYNVNNFHLSLIFVVNIRKYILVRNTICKFNERKLKLSLNNHA